MHLQEYKKESLERQNMGLPPSILNAEQTAEIIDLLRTKPYINESSYLVYLLANYVPIGVDEASRIKANFLLEVARVPSKCKFISRDEAICMLGNMQCGYGIDALFDIKDYKLSQDYLERTIFIYDKFHEVAECRTFFQKSLLHAWANSAWFYHIKDINLPYMEKIVIFRVEGEINTDDFSPATEAQSRSDIPLHAQSFLKNRVDGAIDSINELKRQHPDKMIAFVGDIVGTGSSRKSAINSLQWHLGTDIPYMPYKRTNGYVFGGKIAPIFSDTLRDAGGLPIEMDVSGFKTGDVYQLISDAREMNIYPCFPNDKEHTRNKTGNYKKNICDPVWLDEKRAGGRIRYIIGRALAKKSREVLIEKDIFFENEADTKSLFAEPKSPNSEKDENTKYTLAQKMIGKASGLDGVLPGDYCEPAITTVGSQDTTGPMTKDELRDLACMGFSADLVMQSFCHTAAYPKDVDIIMHDALPKFMINKGAVSLRPGDGIIHSWLNRMLLPDTVGTGGDSHTRFPLGISFPAGSGMVAFAATIGVMPLRVPESVLVKFTGEMQPGITLRDLVNAIPYVALQKGLLTLDKADKKNIFNGRILEIEGLPWLKAEQAFELSDASAERSAGGCTILLDKEPIIEYLTSNVTLLKWMIDEGYEDKRTLERRIEKMEKWLANPQLMQPDEGAQYAEVIEIDLNKITEPLLACPNDPDNIKPLSEVAESKIDGVFIGSCMTNIGHFRAAARLLEGVDELPTELWICPPTKMDEHQLQQEGVYDVFRAAKCRIEIPGCSVCMGNQARMKTGSTVVSTSTRNFPNRMGDNTDVYLSSAEVAAITGRLGHIPTVDEYMKYAAELNHFADDIYRYLNFDQIAEYQKSN